MRTGGTGTADQPIPDSVRLWVRDKVRLLLYTYRTEDAGKAMVAAYGSSRADLTAAIKPLHALLDRYGGDEVGLAGVLPYITIDPRTAPFVGNYWGAFVADLRVERSDGGLPIVFRMTSAAAPR